MNMRDIPAAEAELRTLAAQYDDAKAKCDAAQDADTKQAAIAALNAADAALSEALQKYTGPGVGLVWDDASKKLNVADGWHVDADGNVVK